MRGIACWVRSLHRGPWQKFHYMRSIHLISPGIFGCLWALVARKLVHDWVKPRLYFGKLARSWRHSTLHTQNKIRILQLVSCQCRWTRRNPGKLIGFKFQAICFHSILRIPVHQSYLKCNSVAEQPLQTLTLKKLENFKQAHEPGLVLDLINTTLLQSRPWMHVLALELPQLSM